MTASELASRLNARRSGRNRWTARCPVHGDKKPSLSISVGRKVPVVMQCMSHGCAVTDILSALGLKWADVFTDAPLRTDSATRMTERVSALGCKLTPAMKKRKPLGPLQCTYRYTDDRGRLIAEKLRFEGKVFLWRQPNMSGGWTWAVDRANLPLYHLDEVALATHVILVEGEKDADNLRQRITKPGWAVTTAPNGAKSWKPGYVKWFAKKYVWIIPDNDGPGQEYAALAASQIGAVSKCVRVVNVIQPAKDVSDYLQGHSTGDLAMLMMGTQA